MQMLSIILGSSVFVMSFICAWTSQLDGVDERISLRDLPAYQKDFKCRPYIRAAANLQKMGKAKACDELERLAKEGGDGGKVAILCRMLFTNKAKANLRRPAWGTPVYFGDAKDVDWLTSPIEIVDGIPFFVVNGYMMSGIPEGSLSYLQYCRADGDWSDRQFQEPTAQAAQAALTKLLLSDRWNRTLTEREKRYFRSQLE